jgi:hypothetical protein
MSRARQSTNLHVHLERVPRRVLHHVAAERFRRQVARSAAQLVHLLPLGQLPGEAEVGDLDVEVVIQKDVLRFQIPVDYASRVHVRHPFQHLAHYVPGFLLREGHHRREVIEEFAVFAQFEHQENERRGFEHVLQFDCALVTYV